MANWIIIDKTVSDIGLTEFYLHMFNGDSMHTRCRWNNLQLLKTIGTVGNIKIVKPFLLHWCCLLVIFNCLCVANLSCHDVQSKAMLQSECGRR